MKKVITMFAFFAQCVLLNAQTMQIKEEIIKLEKAGAEAILKKDTVTLKKIWAPGFMVNAPVNRVAIGGQVQMVVSGVISYSSYAIELEEILIKNDVVISMGNETVVPVGNNPRAGQTIKRRYTHFWWKENGEWILYARHANNICQ